ncbi:MAG: hypothetical protein DVB23_000169 [Verrucomicrobia bacterium]|nr:MAG: hypothetical protein DVB23_000169 [Verrucomicrobiota bacterium]
MPFAIAVLALSVLVLVLEIVTMLSSS